MRQLIETTATVDWAVEEVACEPDRGPIGFTPQRRPGDPVRWEGAAGVDDPEQEQGPWRSSYVVSQLGERVAPVEVEARFADGSTERRVWDGRGHRTRIEHVTESRLVAVVVDPDRKYVIDLNVHNNGHRIQPATSTTRTLKAVAHFWLQNVLNGWSVAF
jgi:hypothetical protein